MTLPAGVDAGSEYPTLFSGLSIGPLRSRNRVVFGAHYNLFTERAGETSEAGFYGAEAAQYYADRARGGAGVIIVGGVHTHPTSVYEPANGIAWDERAIPHFRAVTQSIHRYDALAFIQLEHKGSKRNAGWSDEPLLAPSRRAFRHEAPKTIERHELADVVAHFGISARNAAAGGFDGIEVHGAHNYLLNSFMSPQSNHRDDDYGGSFENRMRLVVEVLTAVRAAVGRGMAVGIRLAGDDPQLEPGALTDDDAAAIAAFLEDQELVDFLNVSPGRPGAMVQSLYQPHLLGVYAAETVRKAVSRTPVFAVHRILTPAEAEDVLASGRADAVTVVRALIADPEWPAKAASGRAATIRPCTGCNQSCLGNLARSLPIRCVTNPAVGRERTLGLGTLLPAEQPKRVVVVGGGPAGLEAGWVAAARGHDVILLESSDRLGGKVRLAERLPGRAEVSGFADWRIDECERQGVEIRLGVHADLATVRELAPHAVVVATGGRAVLDSPSLYHRMPIPGSDQEFVVDHEAAAGDLDRLGERVLILDVVGHIEGVGLAEAVAASGRSVTLACPHLTLPQLDAEMAFLTLRRAATAGARWRPATSVAEIRDHQAELIDALSGSRETIGVDSVVVRCLGVPADELYSELRGEVPEVIRVGDAVAARGVDRAVSEGHRAGRQL